MNPYINLVAAIFFLAYSFWKLHHFFAPKVGPIGNGPSQAVVITIWILFVISMIVGQGILTHSIYIILKQSKKG
ncbi:hypothetical protein [Ammoniphilus sp. YIM 78166]|uniref:hypothetical protein n=1 Tax=Ammoniphilus sp. YIM 78166 TaxID=1644106 RepID=UPI00106FCE48|nr:hypothetical protein [Ammoniphilus sp. YIM 78166]